MGVSLRPAEPIPEYEGPNYLVSNLIPTKSLIVLGTEADAVRRRLLLQICSAVQHARPLFDGALQVEQGDAVFVASGPGELERAKEIATRWGQGIHSCTINRSIKDLVDLLSSYPDYRLVVIEDATQQRPPFHHWLSRYIRGAADEKTERRLASTLTNSILQDLRREHAREHMSELLRITFERHVTIILGHGLTTTGNLYDQGAFQGRDEAITLRWHEREGVYRLEIKRSGTHLSSRHWDLDLSREKGLFRLAGRSARRERQAAAAEGGFYPFTETERALLNALKMRGPMRNCDIEALKLPNPNLPAVEGAVIGKSTISERLKALQTSGKGYAVIRLEDSRFKINPEAKLPR